MRRFLLFQISLLLLGIFTLNAQNTDGTDFWLTFGKNWRENQATVVLRIRIVSKDLPASGVIDFTNLPEGNPSKKIFFNIPARSILDTALTTTQKNNCYITSGGKSKLSVHITSSSPITAYALNQCEKSADATNILPVTALGKEYYHVSYKCSDYPDAYAVIAVEDGTNVYYNNGTTPISTLNRGEVYYQTSNSDMTGIRVTTSKDAAYFSLTQGTHIAYNTSHDVLFQQLAPVKSWGYNFLVPVTNIYNISGSDSKDRVRIVASQPTIVTRHGGTHINSNQPGIGNGPVYDLDAGKYIELEVYYNSNGCFIEADKPIGVCPFLITPQFNNGDSDPAQAWLPSMEQLATKALIAAFAPKAGTTSLDYHKAIIISPTKTKDSTKVIIGSGVSQPLTGGTWKDNSASEMSFYNYPMLSTHLPYRFTNDDGIIVMGYGYGPAESYYYLGYSCMLNLSAHYTVNGIRNEYLQDSLICNNTVEFHAKLKDVAPTNFLKWYLDKSPIHVHPDDTLWTHTFSPGTHHVDMFVVFADGTFDTVKSILNIGANIHSESADINMGTIDVDTCVFHGSSVTLQAIAKPSYIFDHWEENLIPISPPQPETYTFQATTNRNLVAFFRLNTVDITVNVNPTVSPPCGSATIIGSTNTFEIGEQCYLEASETNSCYYFVNWTEGSIVLSTNPNYDFTVEGAKTITANFQIFQYPITATVLDDIGGTISGAITYDCGSDANLVAIPTTGYHFVEWVENGVMIVNAAASYTFRVDSARILVAQFDTNTYDIVVTPNVTGYGTLTGNISNIPHFTSHTVAAISSDSCDFIRWTINGVEVSTSSVYSF
ncbi:MAG: hypothetical protein LBI45_01100, partial [Bacteroidales bacterium]|nr:hypothetical protein [Bacteroidales bacterium]